MDRLGDRVEKMAVERAEDLIVSRFLDRVKEYTDEVIKLRKAVKRLEANHQTCTGVVAAIKTIGESLK